MANKKLDYEKTFQLVMECRTSGMSDRQWCIQNDIQPSTLYYWVRRLRNLACYEIPDNDCHSNKNAPSCVVKQDVVRVDIISVEPKATPVSSNASAVLQYRDVSILLQDNFNPDMLRTILLCLKESLC